MDFELTRRILAALEREHARYVVFGAVALAIHGLARATEDLDLFIEPDRENVELYDFASLRSERKPFGDLVVSVVTPRMLYEMKKGTVRPHDWGDAARIAKHFKLEDT